MTDTPFTVSLANTTIGSTTSFTVTNVVQFMEPFQRALNSFNSAATHFVKIVNSGLGTFAERRSHKPLVSLRSVLELSELGTGEER